MAGSRESLNIRIARARAGESRAEWETALSAFDGSRGRVLKRDGGTLVWRGPMLGRDVVVKRWELATMGARLKAVVGASRADRHWAGTEWLLSHGIGAAVCVAMAAEGNRRRWLVMEALRGRSVLELLASGALPIKQQHVLAAQLAEQIVAMVKAGRFNRDHKPSNLIVGDGRVSIVDTVAIKRVGSSPTARTLTMAASLIIEPIGCGCRPRRTLIARFVKALIQALGDNGRAARRQMWRAVDRIVNDHGDPRPRINPLSADA